MSNEAFNKVNQTHALFKKIIAPLKQSLDISFGYMVVFKDGGYYTLVEDMQCLHEFVTHVNKSHIFCDRNITNYFDGEYYFTLWPNTPISPAMEIYHKYNIWNGVTISKINDHCTELYWFTREKTDANWYKFFIRNKQLLLKFIDYFETYKKLLFLPNQNTQPDLFKFSHGFKTNIPKSNYMQESDPFKKLFSTLHSHSISAEIFQLETNLSPREVEILSIICHGFTAKTVGQKLDISVRTVQQYLERIKKKTGLHFKTDLIKFYENHFHKSL